MMVNVHSARAWAVIGTVGWGKGSCENVWKIADQLVTNMVCLGRDGNASYYGQPDRL